MITYKDYIENNNCVLIEQKAISPHLSHLEDLAIEKGKDGFDDFLVQASEILKKIKGYESNQVINAKIDGRPMILFGLDPRPKFKKQFFISLKGGLSQTNPKIAHNDKEIDLYFGEKPDLASRLKFLLATLREAYDNSGKIYQGDVLYASPDDKKFVKIDNEDYIVFKPNVIVYAVPVDEQSELSKRVNSTAVGVVVHDAFKGVSASGGKAIVLKGLGKDISSLVNSSKTSNAFIQSSNFGDATFNVDDKILNDINENIMKAKMNISKVDNDFNQNYLQNPILGFLKIYLNKQVDLGPAGIFGAATSGNAFLSNKFFAGFRDFLNARFTKEREALKTEKGKAQADLRFREILNFLETNKASFNALLTATFFMTKVKYSILAILSQLNSKLGKTFFQQSDGSYVKTKDEGFVLFVGSNHVKIVDRLDFTKMNRAAGGKQRTDIIA